MGMVDFFSILCPELQKLLKTIYGLTRKGRQFVWEKEQQTAFKKSRLDYKNLQYNICQTVGKISFVFRHQ